MTDQSGEDSPTKSSEEIGVSPKVVDSVSPNVCPMDHRGGRVDAVQESTSNIEIADTAVMEDVAPRNTVGDGDLQPVVEEVPAEAEVEDVPAEAEVGDDGEDHRDGDGAVHFGGVRVVRLPPDVPIPSQEMVRRHRRAGHSPYQPWCPHCIAGAANAPAHSARAEVASDGNRMPTPEVHVDYAFFRDRSGEKEETVTVLVGKDRLSSGISADVVPKKGAVDKIIWDKYKV